MRRALPCAVVVGVAALSIASPAPALITRATVLQGPSASVLGIGNAAIAPDGTGGVVWRALSGGVPHIFASQFDEGWWSAPMQVDAGQAGPATFPAIAAGSGGELLVVCGVQPWASESTGGAPATTHYQLMSSIMQPGGHGFGAGPAGRSERRRRRQRRVSPAGDGTGRQRLRRLPRRHQRAGARQPQPPGTITPMRTGRSRGRRQGG